MFEPLLCSLEAVSSALSSVLVGASSEGSLPVSAADSVEASASSLDSAGGSVSLLASAEDSASSLASVEVAVSSSWLLLSSEVAVSALPEAVDCVSLLLPQAAPGKGQRGGQQDGQDVFLETNHDLKLLSLKKAAVVGIAAEVFRLCGSCPCW